jgi:hypothetical protein
MIRFALLRNILLVSLSAFLWIFASMLVFTSIQAASPAQSGSDNWHCQRHGHNDTNRCGAFAAYFGGSGYERYSGSYRIGGHRHGGSEIEAIVCMNLTDGSNSGSCDWFHSWGDGLGREQGCSTPSNDGCYPQDYTYKSGNFANFDNPSSGAAVFTLGQLFVKDAEVDVSYSYTATPRPDDDDVPGPTDYHLACGNGACVKVQNGYEGQPNDDGCVQEGATCGGSAPGRNKCSNNACTFDPNDNGPDQCDTDADCNDYAQGTYGPGYSEGYYQSYYEGTYPKGRNKCSNNACTFDPKDSGPNQCNNDCDCGTCGSLDYKCDAASCVYDPGNGDYAASDCNGACSYGQGTYQGTYQGSYYSEGGYYSQGAYYSQSYYEASYSHSTCTSDGACTIVSGKGANQCSNDYPDCPQPPPICTLTAVPARIVIPPSQSITLTWSCGPVRPPTNCTITNVGAVGTSGSLQVRPTSSVTYALTCTNSAGRGDATIKARVFTGEPGSLKEVVPR